MTGVPHACASTGAMPKSSSAAKTKALANCMWRRSRSAETWPRNVMFGAAFALEARASRPPPPHRRPPIRHRRERLDDQVDPLVRHHSRSGQVIVLALGAERKLIRIHWRINRRGGAAVDLLDPPAHEVGV